MCCLRPIRLFEVAYMLSGRYDFNSIIIINESVFFKQNITKEKIRDTNNSRERLWFTFVEYLNL